MNATPGRGTRTESPRSNGPGHNSNPFDSPAGREKRARAQAVAIVTEDRKNHWKPFWFAITSLEGLPYSWARTLAWNLERKNARPHQ